MSDHAPRTKRGERTRQKLLEAAEKVFAGHGYHDASIVKITEAAGVAQGTFYLYFDSKRDIFDELVEDLNHRVRQAMAQASHSGTDRAEAERLGFAAFFQFTAEHPALYRIIRQAEFVSPDALHRHYDRITQGYIAGLQGAIDDGEIPPMDPVVAAWALTGIGEMIGMRWILWGDTTAVPDEVFDQMIALVHRALGIPAARTRPAPVRPLMDEARPRRSGAGRPTSRTDR